jgi:hypothetical protein
MLEKSPEMTVFISEKELSPADPFLDEEVSKKSRIQWLGEKTKKMQINEEEEKEDPELNQDSNIHPTLGVKTLQLLEQLKEPEVNMVSVLKSKIISCAPKKPKINPEHAESL